MVWSRCTWTRYSAACLPACLPARMCLCAYLLACIQHCADRVADRVRVPIMPKNLWFVLCASCSALCVALCLSVHHSSSDPAPHPCSAVHCPLLELNAAVDALLSQDFAFICLQHRLLHLYTCSNPEMLAIPHCIFFLTRLSCPLAPIAPPGSTSPAACAPIRLMACGSCTSAAWASRPLPSTAAYWRMTWVGARLHTGG